MSTSRAVINRGSGGIFHPRVNKGMKVLTTSWRDEINMRGSETKSVYSKVSDREGVKWYITPLILEVMSCGKGDKQIHTYQVMTPKEEGGWTELNLKERSWKNTLPLQGKESVVGPRELSRNSKHGIIWSLGQIALDTENKGSGGKFCWPNHESRPGHPGTKKRGQAPPIADIVR